MVQVLTVYVLTDESVNDACIEVVTGAYGAYGGDGLGWIGIFLSIVYYGDSYNEGY